MKKNVFLLLNYCIAFILLYLICYHLDLNQILEIFQSVKLAPVIIAILIALFFKLVYFSWLWHMVFSLSQININFQHIFYLNAYTLILKYIIPFKIAEIFRAVGLKMVSKMDFSLALGQTIYLKLITIISILIIFITSCMIKSEFHYVNYGLLLLFVFFLVTQMIYFLPDILFNIDLKQFKHCFKHMAFNDKLKVFLLTLVMEMSEVITLFYIVMAFSLNLQVIDLIYFIGISKLASMIPLSIQGIGIRESIAVSVFGASISHSIAFSVGVSLTLIYHILPAIAGFVIWGYIRLIRYESL